MEGEDKRSFTGEMSEEDDFGTFPDLSVADEFALLVSIEPRWKGNNLRAEASTGGNKG